MSKIQIISEPQTVLGVRYVDVMTDHGEHSKLESEVRLINALYDAGLSQGIIDMVIMPLVEIYAEQRAAENEID